MLYFKKNIQQKIDASNFNGILTTEDTTLQQVVDRIDNHVHPVTDFSVEIETVIHRGILGETLSALTCVKVNENSQIVKCTNNADDQNMCIGILQYAGTIDEECKIITYGICINSSFSRFPQNSTLFISSDGTLTNIVPTNGYIQMIAKVISPERVFVMLSDAIL